MDCKIIENNQYARRESVIISGIPDNINQNQLEENVLHILRSIGMPTLSSYNITACHRLMKKTNDRYPAQTIVRFTNSLVELDKKLPEPRINSRFLEFGTM